MTLTKAKVVFLLCAGVATATAQGIQYEVETITIRGNEILRTGELRDLLTTTTTPGSFSKFLRSIHEELGRPNSYFDHVTFDEDYQRLIRFCEDKGFFEVRIDTLLEFSDKDQTVDITFVVHEGYRSTIDTIQYKGFGTLPDFVLNEIASDPRIVKGSPFDRMTIEDEVRRVRLILWNAGYANAAFVPDSSSLTRYASTRDFSVVLAFFVGKRYVFGEISMQQETTPPRDDITRDIVIDQLDYKAGDIYSQRAWVNSEQNLNRVGVFDQATIRTHVPPDDEESILVPTTVILRPRDRHEIAPELILSDENSTFNLGAGIGYTHRNFLGGARTFSTRLRFRTQTIGRFPDYFGSDTSSIANTDLTFELNQPYIFSNKIRGTWSFSFILEKQRPYRQTIIRNKFGIVDRLATYTTGFFDWTLERVKLTRNPDFPTTSDDPVTQRQIRELQEQEKQAQFNSIFSFTIQRDRSNDLFSPSAGFIHSATVEESGLIPLLLKRAQPELPFTQFYRISLMGRWYTDLTDKQRFAILALKLKGGFEEKYGESRSDSTRSIPQTHRFYAGGGGSVRGWSSRELSATGSPDLGGNLAVEGSVELRTNIFQASRDGILDKLWLVAFVDAGNVWGDVRDGQLKDVAIAAGLGVRYDTIFGPFRADYGFRVYDPNAPAGLKWVTQRKFFAETFKNGVLHFGIGHAF
jgi:outer membrane protein assembly factor BamA